MTAAAAACKRATARRAALSESQWQRSKFCERIANRKFRAPQQELIKRPCGEMLRIRIGFRRIRTFSCAGGVLRAANQNRSIASGERTLIQQ